MGLPSFDGAIGYFLLLIFVGVGAYTLGDFTDINPMLLGIIGIGAVLYFIYQSEFE